MPPCALLCKRVPPVQDPSLAEALYYMGLFNLVSASGPSAVVAATAPLKENLRQLVSALGESAALLCACLHTAWGWTVAWLLLQPGKKPSNVTRT